MAKIVTPSIRKTYESLIKQVVEDLNKPIIVHLPPDKQDCPDCIWDSVNDKSSGKFDSSFVAPVTIFGQLISPIPFTKGRCPVCKGVGYLKSDITKNIKALVRWNPTPADNFEVLPVGREGKAIVRIKVLRADYETVRDSEYILVDGVRCEIIQPATIRGLGTQEVLVVFFLQEVEEGSDIKK